MCGAYMDCNGEKGGSGFYGKQTSKRVYGKWMNLNETRQGRVSQRENIVCMVKIETYSEAYMRQSGIVQL
jgi:hypothetical protein